MRKHNVAAVILFFGFLFSIAALYLLPKSDFSEMEKRFLAEPPVLSWENAISGEWSRQAENYLTDHIPGRNIFVGIHAYMELLAGRQHLKDVWLEEGKLVEAPVAHNPATVERNLKAIGALGEKCGQDIHVMVVPTAGWAAGVEGYTDEMTLAAIREGCPDGVIPIDLAEVFRGRPELYYSTDHHWTSEGTHAGYTAAMAALGREARKAEDFTVTAVEGFQGSTYSRAALWLMGGEKIELWQGSENLTVTNNETEGVHEGIFYHERLEEADKYTVYLDGNHSLVRVRNPEKEGKILVIRDSYGNCLGGFLAESYGEVVLIDLRYYRQAVSQLVEQEGFDDILVCFNCANFLTDTNLMLLR